MSVLNLRNWTIKTRLAGLTVFALIVLVALGGYSIFRLRQLSANGLEMKASAQSVVGALQISRQIGEIRRLTSVFLTTADSAIPAQIEEKVQGLGQHGLSKEDQAKLDRFLQEVKTLSVRLQSLRDNAKGVMEAEGAIVSGLDKAYRACGTETACLGAVGGAVDVYREYLPLGRNIVAGEPLEQGKSVTAVIEKATKGLGAYAKQASPSVKAALNALQGNFYDLEDSLVTIQAIRAKVNETREQVISNLQSLDTSIQEASLARGEGTSRLAEAGDRTARRAVLLTVVSVAIASVFLLLVGYIFSMSIVQPLHRVVSLLKPMATGDLRGRLEVSGKDEPAEMAGHFNHFLEQIGKMVGAVRRTSGSVEQASAQLGESAQQMLTAAESSVRAARTASEQMDMVNKHMVQAATMVDNLSIATNDIAKNTSETATLSERLSEQIEESREVITQLSDHAQKVGDVVNLIRSIADQTNLLALNATIEAARAGEAGKGFGVVANEVKELAKQTADATERIAPLISSIQQQVERAVGSIAESVSATSLLRDSATTVAAAVEEQTATYQEINQEIQEVSEKRSVVKEQVDVLTRDAERTLNESESLRAKASALLKEASELEAQVSGLVVN